jgi:hypothetical protein
MFDEDIIFTDSAFYHDIEEQDIRHAFKQRVYDKYLANEDSKNLLIGFDRNANLLEVLYNIFDNGVINVFHAMRCRKVYREFLKI